MGRAPALLCLGLAGCLAPSLVPCGDLLCPDDTTCLADRGVCASPDALAVCDGQPDGTPCLAPHIDGACDAGLCVASTCGDGIAQGHEQCDGAATLTCADFRFYTGTPTCTSACLYDTSGCAGRCGDGIIQEEAGEVCDGNLPDRGCVDLGYDYGHLTCTAICTDSSLLDCGRYEPDLVFLPGLDGGVDILDVWRENGVVAISRGASGLIVLDHGTRYDVPGAFGRIAREAGQIAIAHADGVDLLVGHGLSALPALGTNDATVGVAYAPNGNLWAISRTCEVRELVGGAWQVRASASAPSCDQLAIDGDGVVYTLAAAQPQPSVQALAGGTWAVIPQTDSAGWLGPDAGGKVMASLRGSLLGLADLTATRAKLVSDAGTYFEGVPLDGGAYLVTSIELARVQQLHDALYFHLQRQPLHLRAMADGSVLMWWREVTELGALEVSEARTHPIGGLAHDATLGWVYWGDPADGNPPTLGVIGKREDFYSLPLGVNDLAATNGQIYAIAYNEVDSGPPGGLVADRTIGGFRVRATAAGDVVIIATDGTIRVRPAGASEFSALPSGCADTANEIVVLALDDLYAVRGCATNVIEHWNGTAWSTAYSMTSNLTRAAVLDDGTVAFVGSRVVVGRGTQWTELPASGTSIAGTSAIDLWLGNAQVSGAEPPGLLHYDGHTFARVRWPDTDIASFVVTDAHTVFAASYATYRFLGRFP